MWVVIAFAVGVLVGRIWSAIRNFGEAAHPNGDNHE